MNIRIPLAKPEITDTDRDAVLSVLRAPRLSMGPKVAEFEQGICQYIGSKHAVAVNSGTSALHLAIRALNLDRGSEVILPSFTFSALLNVILLEGLRPKFVDIDPATYNTSPELVQRAITESTRLILAVHTFGVPVDTRAILTASTAALRRRGRPRHTIHVLEDACEALGAEVTGQKAGTLGQAGLFAFYPNKQITTGEGGVLVTDDEPLASKARVLRNQGRDPALDWSQHAELGFSYRLSDINCTLGISQLARIESVIQRRQDLALAYDRALAKLEGVIPPPTTSALGRISWFVYVVRLSHEFTRSDRDRICRAMGKRGIATGRYFAPLHRQPVFVKSCSANAEESGIGSLAHTETVADRVIALPFFNQLMESEIHEVCGALEESICELRRRT